MHSAAVFCVALVFTSSVYGGSSERFLESALRQIGKGPGWGSGPGWSGLPGPIMNVVGVSQAIGIGGATAEHDATVIVSGSVDVPAHLSLGGGSNVGLSQSVSNYQQSQINADGSSAVYQGNSASNDGYANEYMDGSVQGLTVDTSINGWSGLQGEGSISQADALEHEGPSGWK